MADQLFALYRLDRDLTRAQVIEALAAMPGQLRDVIAGQTPGALTRKVVADGWSAIETLRHIRDAVQVYGMRFKWMILQDDPFLANYDEDRWVSASPDGPEEAIGMLGEISAYRGETVRLLRALSPDGWSRRGRHEILGPVELEPYVRHELAHEEGHLEQITKALREAR